MELLDPHGVDIPFPSFFALDIAMELSDSGFFPQ